MHTTSSSGVIHIVRRRASVSVERLRLAAGGFPSDRRRLFMLFMLSGNRLERDIYHQMLLPPGAKCVKSDVSQSASCQEQSPTRSHGCTHGCALGLSSGRSRTRSIKSAYVLRDIRDLLDLFRLYIMSVQRTHLR